MNWEMIIENLGDLIQCKNVRIDGLNATVNILKDREKKLLRELKYLEKKYDNPIQIEALKEAIELAETLFG